MDPRFVDQRGSNRCHISSRKLAGFEHSIYINPPDLRFTGIAAGVYLADDASICAEGDSLWKTDHLADIRAINIGYLLNNLLPLRAGELGRRSF